MDRGQNPFSPGAGTPPPELAGRAIILEDALVALQRVQNGRSEKSLILVGLRGVGKTVLLREIRKQAMGLNYKVAFIEAADSRQKRSLANLLVPHLRTLLLEMAPHEKVSHLTQKALRTLASFIKSFKANYEGYEFSYAPELGAADSGMLDVDLARLFTSIGEAAKDNKTAVAIMIDELQYLEDPELGALIMAMHHMAQEGLPLIFIGAGLPQLVGKAGRAKSYAERLFQYPEIGPLEPVDAFNALKKPLNDYAYNFETAALEAIYNVTQGYPYFIQEWGYHAWNVASPPVITEANIVQATQLAVAKLDKEFFRVRFDRLTPNEKQYVRTMAELGGSCQRSGDIADRLGKKVEQVAPVRGQLINKGMIYSPAHGDNAFTVPLFDEFLKRELPLFNGHC
jgi:hypothetical protein